MLENNSKTTDHTTYKFLNRLKPVLKPAEAFAKTKILQKSYILNRLKPGFKPAAFCGSPKRYCHFGLPPGLLIKILKKDRATPGARQPAECCRILQGGVVALLAAAGRRSPLAAAAYTSQQPRPQSPSSQRRPPLAERRPQFVARRAARYLSRAPRFAPAPTLRATHGALPSDHITRIATIGPLAHPYECCISNGLGGIRSRLISLARVFS